MSETGTPSTPKVNVRFIHAFCDDVGTTRAFYEDGLGMTLQSTLDEEQWGWAVYQCEGFQLMFHRWTSPLDKDVAWSWQPGDGAGDAPTISFGIEIPEDGFRAVVDRLAGVGTSAITPVPTWRQGSYWGWTVRDPNGNTVEVYTMASGDLAPAEGVEDPVWQA